MAWLSNILGRRKHATAEDVVKFYQSIGFFDGTPSSKVVADYFEIHGETPNPDKPWDDTYLLAFSKNGVVADDPEADVCAGNKVYADVLKQWGEISSGAFSPLELVEDWDGGHGPIAVHFKLDGRSASVHPAYLDDWIDLDVLKQINALIAASRREFAYAIDGNHSVVVCVTPEQKTQMTTQRRFPFAW